MPCSYSLLSQTPYHFLALLAIHYGYMAWYFASHTFEKLSTGTGEEKGEEISITFVNVKPFQELLSYVAAVSTQKVRHGWEMHQRLSLFVSPTWNHLDHGSMLIPHATWFKLSFFIN
ncbi:hypothetical protein J1N35_025159 [Gossypium stocksii]|uniref:Uncharacterized protein n=1 Tax=Gossypium stocksii TaxID=47602 RepID=A0A9D3V737_9ROSI|nr:hypothetical protein J1N35_025159 [Gossypium stocksii]